MAGERIDGGAKTAFGLALALIVAAVAVDDGTAAWIAGIPAVVLLIYAMAKAPPRVSLMVLMFCALTMENPGEVPAAGFWKSPLYPVGALLLTHMNNTTGARWMSFSGMDVLLGSMIVITLYRRASASRDSRGRTPMPKPLIQLAFVSLGGAAYAFLNGMLRGGEFSISLWQLDRVVYLPTVFLLFSAALRGPEDYPALGKVILAAGTVKALLATYVAATVTVPKSYSADGLLPYATSHHDSILFATSFVLLISLVLNRAGRSATRLSIVLVPILMMGMVANNRRMVWVQIAMVFFTLFLTTPPNPLKRKVKRLLLLASPLIAVYIIAGWGSPSGVFKPVQMVRSIVDPQSDASTMWREIENYDLIFTIRQSPIFGTGYGHGYIEAIALPPVDYPLERYCPHNSILGLWAYCGYFGYTAITALWVAGAYFAMRAYHNAKRAIDKAAALSSFGVVLVYLIQCWGDMGLGSWTGVFTMATGIAVAGKLSVALGVWVPLKRARPDSSASAPDLRQQASPS